MDLTLFKMISKLSGRFPLVDGLMIFVSNRIRYTYLMIIVLMLFKNRKNKRIALETSSSVLLSIIAQFFIKVIYHRPRPFKRRKVGILIPSKMDSSFPSKHTMLTFAASTTILMFHRTLGKILIWLSVLTGFSRIWVGHHYPSDILGSALLGSVISLVTRFISFRQYGTKPEDN
ncbi:phosphatase PAP2 family protein [Mesobacillus subterraneus]|uniref:Phosphatase PAP2 family protein n=1 Tax=Mesobacillus subterraneus TaxID=285983 RepID=A0A3R9DWA0_9BACI|nr:phosphatase PAP2 family protein [Mesobacillus subterraneus]RSD28845.1 phosphatase PAP2 family protein [Mesobacillus subterraneus]